jgi:ribosome-binding factor A
MSHNPQVRDIKQAQKEKLLFREISHLLLQLSLEDPRLRNITLSRVKLSPDRSICFVYFYTPEGKETFEDMLELLKLYKASMRKSIASKIEARYTPDLRFMFDDKYEKQERLEQLLEKVKSEE